METSNRLKQYLDDMATTLSSLTGKAEQAGKDKAQLRSFFKQLHSLLLTQQKNDISAARNDHQLSELLAGAKRKNTMLLDQKKSCIKKHVAKINHIKEKIATTAGHDDRARYQEILSVIEELATDEACKWDMDIMLQWFNSYTKPSTKSVAAGGQELTTVNEADATATGAQPGGQEPTTANEADATATGAQPGGQEPTTVNEADATATGAQPGGQEPTTVNEADATATGAQPGGQEPTTVSEADATATGAQLHKSSVVRALDLYAEEVREYLSHRLKEVEEDISTLRQHHHAAFVADVDRTLSVFARMGAVPGVTSIREDVSHLKQLEVDVNTQHVISTIVDKAQEQYERSEKADRQSWEALLLRIQSFRDANATRNDAMLQNTLELTTTMNREIDAVVASTTELSLGMDALQSEETRRLVQIAVNDLIATLNTT